MLQSKKRAWSVFALILFVAAGASAYFVRVRYTRQIERTRYAFKILWLNGRYDLGITNAEHASAAVAADPLLHFYYAGFLTGKNRLREASKQLAGAGNVFASEDEIRLLSNEINRRLQNHSYPFLVDRHNVPLVDLTLDRKPVFQHAEIRPLLQNRAGDYLKKLMEDAENQAVLAIDSRIQDAAETALGKYSGAIVLLDVNTGDILAAAGNAKNTGSSYAYDPALALTHLYEPGSIIKLVTTAGAIENGFGLQNFFPLKCNGAVRLPNGSFFYDWKKHGQLDNVNVAMAVSCNVAFVRIGLGLGQTLVQKNLRWFGFDSKLPAFLPLELGRILPRLEDDHYVADLSIGLDYLEITPLHAAMIAAAIANKGQCALPRLLLERRNVLGIPFEQNPPANFRRFMSEKTAEILTSAMIEVVRNPEGTGRRATVDGFPIAVKTGTVGDIKAGYNSAVIGFGPLPSPKIAFAIFLENSGKAELEGARITKLFLESIKGYIR